MARRRQKGEERAIALARIATLMRHAQTEVRGAEPALADRYAELAVRIAMKHQSGLGEHAARVCRACHAFLVPGRSCRVRGHGAWLTTTCLRCGHVRRKGVAQPAAPSGTVASPPNPTPML